MRHSFQFFRNMAKNPDIPPIVIGAIGIASVADAMITFVSAQAHTHQHNLEKQALRDKRYHDSEKDYQDSLSQFNAQKEAFKSRLDEFKAL